MVPGIVQRDFVARDGTRIGYQVRAPSRPAPCVVLANGLGGTHIMFKHLYDALGDYRTLCWDYRGLYTSSPPSDPRANTVLHQVGDLIELLDREGIDEVVIAGWSMGVQVAIETIRRHPSRVRGVLAINGTFGHAFRTVMGSRLAGRAVPLVWRLIKAQAGLIGRASRHIAGRDAVTAAMMRAGLVSRSADIAVFRAVIASFRDMDWRIYSDLMTRLDEHDAEDVLASIDVPFTIVTGDRDLWTPPSTAEHMHRAIRGSRLVTIEGASHYTPVEYPGVLVDELDRLLARVPGWERGGWERDGSGPGQQRSTGGSR